MTQQYFSRFRKKNRGEPRGIIMGIPGRGGRALVMAIGQQASFGKEGRRDKKGMPMAKKKGEGGTEAPSLNGGVGSAFSYECDCLSNMPTSCPVTYRTRNFNESIGGSGRKRRRRIPPLSLLFVGSAHNDLRERGRVLLVAQMESPPCPNECSQISRESVPVRSHSSCRKGERGLLALPFFLQPPPP